MKEEKENVDGLDIDWCGGKNGMIIDLEDNEVIEKKEEKRSKRENMSGKRIEVL